MSGITARWDTEFRYASGLLHSQVRSAQIMTILAAIMISASLFAMRKDLAVCFVLIHAANCSRRESRKHSLMSPGFKWPQRPMNHARQPSWNEMRKGTRRNGYRVYDHPSRFRSAKPPPPPPQYPHFVPSNQPLPFAFRFPGPSVRVIFHLSHNHNTPRRSQKPPIFHFDVIPTAREPQPAAEEGG